MVLRPPPIAPAVLLALAGCDWDRVPILAADRCFDEFDATVVNVLDGDTFTFYRDELPADFPDPEGSATGTTTTGTESTISVRMLGVDAPEIEHPDQPEECYGPESAANTSSILSGNEVTLRSDVECYDGYERILAYVYVLTDVEDSEEESFVNASIIRDGFAQVYEDFDDILLADLLYDAQWAAQDDGAGIWSACF